MYLLNIRDITSRWVTKRALCDLLLILKLSSSVGWQTEKKMFLGGLIVLSSSLKLSMIAPLRSSYVGFLWSTTVMHVIMRNVFKRKSQLPFIFTMQLKFTPSPWLALGFLFFVKLWQTLNPPAIFRALDESECGRDASMSGDTKQKTTRRQIYKIIL